MCEPQPIVDRTLMASSSYYKDRFVDEVLHGICREFALLAKGTRYIWTCILCYRGNYMPGVEDHLEGNLQTMIG